MYAESLKRKCTDNVEDYFGICVSAVVTCGDKKRRICHNRILEYSTDSIWEDVFLDLTIFCCIPNVYIMMQKKKKKPTYLPTSKIGGQVRGNRNIFNCGLIFTCFCGRNLIDII